MAAWSYGEDVRRLTFLALAVMLAGCSATPDPAPPPSPTPSPSCPASAELSAAEQQGNGSNVTLWALFFAQRVTVGQELKVAWRMTGSGDFAMTAAGPGGAELKPSWGPEAHSGSTFRKPGEEWGTGWVFPAAGCWTFTASRGADSARLAIRVG